MANTGAPSRGKKKRPFRRKRRSWLFKIEHATNHGITGADLLASVCHRYSTVKKLVVKSASPETERNADERFGAAVRVEIRFAGPQPSESCGALLCLLLGGDSVQAWPVELPRGRKRKNAMSTEGSVDAPDDVRAADAASASPPRNSASGVLGILPPPPRRRESYDCEDEEDTQDMPPHPPEYHQHPQRHQHPPFQEMHQHQHHQHHRPFGAHDAVPDPDVPFPAVQPRREARSLQSEMAAYSGCGGGGGSGGGGGGSPFSAPGGVARSFNVDGSGVLLPMEEVMVEPSRKECDLEGRPFPTARMADDGAPTGSGPADDRQCHLVFTGLEDTGHDLNSLRVTALFGVDAVHQTATMAGPLQVGADGRVYSSLFYPSLQEIWPELYVMPNVPVVEVDIEVEILSDSGGEYRYHGPQLKVVYHRAWPPANVATGGGSARGGSSRGPMPPRSPDSYAAGSGAGVGSSAGAGAGAGDGEFRPIYSHPGADC